MTSDTIMPVNYNKFLIEYMKLIAEEMICKDT